MTFEFPRAVLEQHIGIVGKTGSGKTNTAKVVIEKLVRDGSRVCVLDPIKSDWWGLTASADGKSAGLPFHILGGPRGHVPLHDGAGAAIAGLVAGRQLPLSIIDMADFRPGGSNRFFVAFAEQLIRKMSGVLYLVLEEAHLFAPKERSGLGEENMAIHWAKTLATAGRSKGVRLIVITQRTQALHNAILGSCDTIFAHRLTAPADQAPVLAWLKSNTTKETAEKVSGSLASLKKGEVWMCSGEAGVECIKIPLAATFDNSATPTDDDHRGAVKTFAGDIEALRAAVGDAIKAAEDNDPKVLRERIRVLEVEVKKSKAVPTAIDPRLTDSIRDAARRDVTNAFRPIVSTLTASTLRIQERLSSLASDADVLGRALSSFEAFLSSSGIDPAAHKIDTTAIGSAAPAEVQGRRNTTEAASTADVEGPVAELTRMERSLLSVLAQRRPMSKGSLLVHAGYASSGPVSKCFAAMSERGWITSERGQVAITPRGRGALGPIEPLPTGDALRTQTLRELSTMEAALLRVFFQVYPDALSKGHVLEAAGYASSGPTSKAFARLTARGFIVKHGGLWTAAEEFFA